jgi:hypothetical protein
MLFMETEKRRTTIYIDPKVLEFLTIRRAKGAGSVSQQLEGLAKGLMPADDKHSDIKALECKHIKGYKKQPVKKDEFDDFYTEQSLENL